MSYHYQHRGEFRRESILASKVGGIQIKSHKIKCETHRALGLASLTVPDGQEFHFTHSFLKFRSIFPQTFLIFFLILALWVGECRPPGKTLATPLETQILRLNNLGLDTKIVVPFKFWMFETSFQIVLC